MSDDHLGVRGYGRVEGVGGGGEIQYEIANREDA